MAATVSNLDFSVDGDKRATIGTITGDTSYTSGGYAISPSAIGLANVLDFAADLPVSSVPAIRAARWDYTNNKLMFFDQAFAEIANGIDLSAYSLKFRALGW